MRTMPRPEPVITTIIPTYRRPRLLQRAIRSALNQSFARLEVCVYDNASGDETAGVVAQMSRSNPRVTYHCHPHNIGAVNNFRYGMSQVQTPFFSCLSDDDLILPWFYESALEVFDRHPDVMFVAGTTVVIDEKGIPAYVPLREWRPGLYRPPDGFVAMWENGHPKWTGILFRREVIQTVGLPDERVGLPGDLDFELRIARRLPFYVLGKACALFVTHEAGDSLWKSVAQVLPGYMIMLDRVLNDSGLAPALKERVCQAWSRQVRGAMEQVCYYSLRHGADDEALRAAEVLRKYADDSFETRVLLRVVGLSRLGGTAKGLASIFAHWRRWMTAVLRIIRFRFGRRRRRLYRSYVRHLTKLSEA